MLAWENQQFALIHRTTFMQLKLAPETPEIRHNFAAIESMREGGLESAIETLEELVLESPEYTHARLTLASCYHEANRPDDARREADWIVENDPIAPAAVAEKEPKCAAMSDAKKKELVGDQCNRMLATMFMDGAHWGFKPLLRDLESEFALGAALHPETIDDVLQVLAEYMQQPTCKAIMKKKRNAK